MRATGLAVSADHGRALAVEEITSPGALEALAPEWVALFDSCPDASPFQAPEWLLAWRRAFLKDGLWSLALRRAGELVGVAPLFVHRDPQDGARQLTLLGNGLGDRLDLLARPDERAGVAAAVAAHIGRALVWDRLDFRDLPHGSPLITMALPEPGRQRLEPEEPCPVLALPADPGALTAGLPKSRRTDLRRCARRLAEIAPFAFTRADASTRQEHLDALVRLHGARWRERGEAGVLCEAAVIAFHAEATRRLLARGLLRLEALRLAGRIVAVHYGLVRGTRGYSYLHAFDPELSGLGPGWLLMSHVLGAAVREGVRSFDFLRGGEAYKYAWGAVDRPQWRRRAWR